MIGWMVATNAIGHVIHLIGGLAHTAVGEVQRLRTQVRSRLEEMLVRSRDDHVVDVNLEKWERDDVGGKERNGTQQQRKLFIEPNI